MELHFLKVTERHYSLYRNSEGYAINIGCFEWCKYERQWEVHLDTTSAPLRREEIQAIHAFFQGLEDPNDSTD